MSDLLDILAEHLPPELKTADAIDLALKSGRAVLDALDGVVHPGVAEAVLEAAVRVGVGLLPADVGDDLRAAILHGLYALVQQLVILAQPSDVVVEVDAEVTAKGTLEL